MFPPRPSPFPAGRETRWKNKLWRVGVALFIEAVELAGLESGKTVESGKGQGKILGQECQVKLKEVQEKLKQRLIQRH